MTGDPRIPLRFGPPHSRRADEAVLTDGPPAAAPAARFSAGHLAGCACCGGGGAVLALAQLVRARALGGAFQAVLATASPEGEAAVRAALAEDGPLSARFRLAQPAG